MALRNDLTLVSNASKARVLADFTTLTDSSESDIIIGMMRDELVSEMCVQFYIMKIFANHNTENENERNARTSKEVNIRPTSSALGGYCKRLWDRSSSLRYSHISSL